MKPIDVRAPVRKAIELAREQFKKNGIAIDSTLPNDLPKVLGDEAALTEAFAHLVTNAAEATSGRTKPRITLGRSRNPRRWAHQRSCRDRKRQRQGNLSGIKGESVLAVLHDQSPRNGIGSADRETDHLRS